MSERFSAQPNNLDVGADLPHCSRYFLARGFVKSGETVIDAACGHGYGSRLLSEVAGKVYSFDRLDVFNPEWKRDNIEFNVQNFEVVKEFPKCDTFITIETIEHLTDPQRFLDKITDATKKMIVISSPNKPTAAEHEFHLTDVLINDCRTYMNKYDDWFEYHSFIQGYTYIIIFCKKGVKLI